MARILLSSLAPRSEGTPEFDVFSRYLAYRSRGLPRLLLAELNDFTVWRDGEPSVVVKHSDAKRVAFFAWLQGKLAALPDPPASLQAREIDSDRFRMGAYLITDWAIGRGSVTFSASDLIADAATRPDPRVVPPEIVEGTLEPWPPHLSALSNARKAALQTTP